MDAATQQVAGQRRRFVVVGIGAIGGVIAARMSQAGFDVSAVARGDHLAAVQRSGLTLRTPHGSSTVHLPAFASPRDVDWHDDDAVIIAVKSQDTEGVIVDLASSAPPSITVACAQNGVANELSALRRFRATLGVSVISPAAHLAPGVVQAHSSPCPGILDVGRYPSGSDATVEAIAAAFRTAGFESLAVPDVMRWKYAKLLVNLGNAVEAVCGRKGAGGKLAARVRREGIACLDAAGIAYASADEDAARRAGMLSNAPVDGGMRRGGGSSWQSLTRGAGSIETDYLNGEIVLLGRLHGIATPANTLIQRTANDLARAHLPPGQFDETALLAQLPAEAS